LGEQVVERGDVGKSAWTLEGFEEVAGIMPLTEGHAFNQNHFSPFFLGSGSSSP
jgi:hypothetical protein